ncbi:hypothetical protein [Bacillus phage SPO1L3]|nr:hypothetical protein Goe10_c01220 [Bacillus phage vB_BsuM-Goe10]WIT26254.1 hypothetical protein [Bacillus phage SPO1L3]WIT26651.1 hypothetical protein [Bacillus phage SPO1L5]
MKITDKEGKVLLEVIKEVGVLETSATQELRVNIVKDDRGRVKVAIQKYWRKSKEDEWNIGKGLFVTGRDAVNLSPILEQAGNEIIHIR